LWTQIGTVERFLRQPWTAIRDMTIHEFKLHLYTACYWADKEARAAEEAREG
jgi:hypothetical protein